MSQKLVQSTAILIFSRSSQEDAIKKNISGGAKLFDALNEHFLIKVQNTGLPYFFINGENQHGDTFGERFSHAVESVFNNGYDNVITIGNDSPRLNETIIKDAALQLTKNNTIIGPSVDGGFYLLGIHRSNFDREKFENLSWQTPKIVREIQKILEAKDRKYSVFSTLFDIDCLYDLKIFISQDNSCSKRLHDIAKDIFDYTISKYLFVDIIDEQLSSTPTLNKGSPVQ
ncbi:DUF2064 domain-containing protein [Aurantibacter crassamenti]|uniref:TIGR04282 family arsenosugar biosynthesis glycosyltransferase n=1 Tax=Aurantibacter crassamenti TaxID=1837375 RepID=UPI001939379A|nr:DUF2064 domain-containing protein [Aurantibacter crassamenti]MBM1105274.1 DUF2064 domain-containing protein [Aurantibacter crassamenti]